jgi:hypothetical protein
MMKPRNTTRIRSFLKARLIFNDGNSSLDGLVRDLSESGARLQVSDSVALPDRFDLYIAKKDETRKVRIKWRTNDEVGVAFEEIAAAPQSHNIDLARRLSELEAEVTELRRSLEELRAELHASLNGMIAIGSQSER